MKTEEFWQLYLNEDLLDIFDVTYDFFSKKLPEDFLKEYDVVEVLLETKGAQIATKNFDNAVKFINLIKDKHPKLYLENYFYFDDFLIDYYCYHKNIDKIHASFENFHNDPLLDIDFYFKNLKKLLFHGHQEILNKTVEKNYQKINNIANAFDLALFKFTDTLEKFYKKNDFDINEFMKIIEPYDFDIQENKEFRDAVIRGMTGQFDQDENLIKDFFNDQLYTLISLQIYFQKYMYGRHMPFAIGYRIWLKMGEFWDENNQPKKIKPLTYFSAGLGKFEKYVSSLSGNFFVDNTSEMFAVAWGSVYVYDFLKEAGLIDTKVYNKFYKISKSLKGKIIGETLSDLWKYTFIHSWKKPDSIPENEFVEEAKIFRKSYDLPDADFSELQNLIADELNHIGDISNYIIKGGKEKDKRMNDMEKVLSEEDIMGFFGNDLEDFVPDDEDTFQDTIDKLAKPKIRYYDQPYIAEKKVGRNAPCPCGSGKKYKKCCGKRS